MDTGLHSVGLNVTSLKCTVGECENDAGEIQIPESLEYTDEVVRGYEIGFENQEVQESTSEALPPGEAISQISTQTRRDAEARIILENMLSSRLEDSQLVPTQVQPCSSPELVETNCKYKASLSSFKVSQIQGNGLLARTASAAGLASDACKARCQCGNDELDVDMLQCSFCNTKQHLICYGFLHPNDQRIPATHACYKCLLEPEEFSIMKQMYTLVLLRKAIKIINDEGYPNQIKDFAQKMHCSGQTIVQVIGVLKKKKLISATPGSKSRGFAAKKLPKFSIPASEEVKKILRQEIFNPLAKISHHYNICPISEESPPENCAPEAPITDTSARRDRHFSSTLDKDKGSQGRKHGPSTSPPSSPPRSQHHQPMVERELLNTSTVEVARTPSVCFVTTQNNSTMQENQRYKRRKLSNAGNPMSFDDPMD
ncbi:DNA binding protein [Myotisia sp. PD_48]|nr:DNA binding protein [Myotisia sp. PD_48]